MSASPTTVTQGQVVNLTASATDNASSTITKVDFYDGSTLIGSDTSSPYTLAWNTNTTTATGAHSLTAKATDAVPLTGTSNPVSVTVNAAPPADTTPPTVSLTAPSNGATLSGTTVNIAATASDNVGVTKVVFSRGTTVLATDTTAPYGLTWDSTTAADGTYNISATAYDAANNSSSSSVSVTVSNAPPPPTEAAPVVFLSAPANGAIVSGSGVTLSATATDTDSTPVAKVVFTVDGASITNGIDTTSPYSVTWNSTSVTNGNHTIMATATDTAGLSSSSQYAITVNNGDITPPSTPTNLTATASAYNKVDLSWIASTDYVGVTGYYVVRNGTTIAQTSSTSYSDTTVSANTAYTYNLYARDAAGNLSAISNSAFVTTPKQPDTQAPTWPSTGANLTATAVSTSQINLTWSAATDNVGVVSYRIFRDSGTTPIATVSTTSYGDSGLSASTTYSYTVKAVDASLNASLDSNIASATTQAVPPPPTVGNLAGNVTTISNSGNPYSCSSHPTLAKTASAPTDQTILTCNKRVQWFLNSINNAGLSVDGWFGNNTETAVKNYQTKFSLTSDGSGIVGSQTWNSLETKGAAAANNPYSCSTHPTLSKTASAPTDATILACDKRVQWFLNSLNNAGLSVDGWFGNNTETAVKNYQLKFGLTADGSGIVGSQTWNSLESKGTASVYGFGSGASVSYTSGGSQHTVTADNEGYYIMTNIVPGSYGFTYSLPNYASQTATISITSGQTATYNVTLSHL